MNILLDTTAFSDLMREHPKVEERLRGLTPSDRIMICTIVRGEVAYGIARLPHGKRRRALEKKANALFSTLLCEPVPESAGDHYARVKIARQRAGATLDENDLWIAATALALEASMITRDSDFRQVEGLTVEDWTT